MNRLAQFAAQARAVWAGMSLGAKVTCLAFLGGMTALLVGLGVWSGQTDYALLFGGLSPEDAAAISTRLSDDKVPFRYEASRGAILVPAARADAARLSLASLGLPKGAADGYEIFDKSLFSFTDFSQHINYLRALQTTLARNIQALDGVDNARVNVTLPEEEIFVREKREAKASVVVRMKGGRNLSGDQVNSIRHMVAASVPKLEPNNVTVVDSAGQLLSRPQEANDPAALTEDQLALQQRVETHFADKVQSLLDQVLGAGQSVVRVTAQLNFERVERSLEKMDPESGVLLEEANRNDDTAGHPVEVGGAPGIAANGAPGSGGERLTGSHKQKTVTNRFHYDITTEKIVPEIGALKRLSVAVLLAAKPAPGGGAGAPLARRTPQELTSLTEIVRSAVGFSVERKDVIRVEEVAFSEAPAEHGQPAAAPPVAPAPGYWQDIFQQHLSDILAFAGILVMVAVFWKLFGRVSAAAPALPETLGSRNGPGGSRTVNLPGQPEPRASVHTELKELVTQNNTQAVNIIRSMLK